MHSTIKYYQSTELFNPDAGFQKGEVLMSVLYVRASISRNIYLKNPHFSYTILVELKKKIKHVLPRGSTGNWL